MSDTKNSDEKPRCPDCGEPGQQQTVESTAMGPGGGRERQRGASICVNQGCPMYGRAFNG